VGPGNGATEALCGLNRTGKHIQQLDQGSDRSALTGAGREVPVFREEECDAGTAQGIQLVADGNVTAG